MLNSLELIEVHPIGYVESSLKLLEDCPLQGSEGAPEATVKILDSYKDALLGITEGTRLVLLTWLHVAKRDVLQCYPRKHKTAGNIGVFATRSPDRPNPIGLHQVQVIKIINDREIKVFPLEVLDGTFLLDIKLDLR